MTKQIFDIDAVQRTDLGKGASRRLRRVNNDIPAILYGGKKVATPITLNQNKILHALENDAFYSHILNLSIDGQKERVILKDLQRHPYKKRITHMDFLRISEDTPITIHAPLHFTGEDLSPGVKAGGIVSHHQTDIEIRCLPKDLPEFIQIDLSTCELNAIIHLSEVTLPKGVTLPIFQHGIDPTHDVPVVSIHLPRAALVEEEVPVEAEAVPTISEIKAAEEEAKKGSPKKSEN